MSALKAKILKFMQENDLSPSALATKSQISPGILHNIIESENANPTIASIIKLAHAMGYSVDELVEHQHSHTKNLTLNNLPLLKSISNYLCKSPELENKPFKDYCQIIGNIYKYCQDHHKNKVDQSFAKWYIAEYFADKKSF